VRTSRPLPLDSRGNPLPAAVVKGISAESRLRMLSATIPLQGTQLQARSTATHRMRIPPLALHRS